MPAPQTTQSTEAASAPSACTELRSVDRELLLALRSGDTMGIDGLTDILGVTATAVRQRVERLLHVGLIEREKIVAGRGRPTYQYRLTVAGHQRAGANPAELADAMWRAILEVEDSVVRESLINNVAAQLGQQFAAQLSIDDPEMSFSDRMTGLSKMLSARQIETEVQTTGPLPVLDICSCPYPSLTDTSDERSMCRLEEKMISEALGQAVHLSSCRLDGDQCCQFSAVDSPGSTTESINSH